MRRAIFLTALAVILASSASGTAQETNQPAGTSSPLTFSGRISGTVLTEGRELVQGASVAAIADGGRALFGSSTDERGRYAVKSLQRSTYSVLVTNPGGGILRKDNVRVRPLFRNLVDFITEAPTGLPGVYRHPLPVGMADGETLHLTGELVTPENVGIAEAWVTVTGLSDESQSMRARTDVEGRFRLLNVPAGHYRIHAQALGHITWSLGPILLLGGEETTLNLILLPFPLGHQESLEDLVVPVEPAAPERFEKELREKESGS